MISRSFWAWSARATRQFILTSLVVGALALVFGLAPVAKAAEGINQQINYQGKLTASNGSIVADGTYQIKFSLYTVSSAGTPIWTASGTTGAPTALSVSVVSGLFTVMLGDTSVAGGSQNSLDGLDWNTDSLYLGVTVGSDGEMTPRKRLGAVPQAFNSMLLQGMSASGTAELGTALFTINQTSPTASDFSQRSALDVKTSGTSMTEDFIARFYNSSGTAMLRVRNDGRTEVNRLYSSVDLPLATVMEARNIGDRTQGTAWAARFNTLLVNSDITDATTGTNDFISVFKYVSSFQNAICLDNSATAATCRFHSGASLVAEGSVDASAFNTVGFDLAERYRATGDAEPGDLLSIDPENPMFVRRSTGVAYDRYLAGVVSTAPGVSLGDVGDVAVALSGRVPTKVSAMNGAISVGDVLTSSPIPGVAMKATGPGRTVGYALESATATSTIEMFVKVGYDAGSFLTTNEGEAITNGNLIIDSTSNASPDLATAHSWGVTWRGSVWDGLQSLRRDFTLVNQTIDATRSLFALTSGTSTLWSVDQTGNAQISGDLTLGGRFFPATRSGSQSDKYIFLDDTGPASSTYIATNADGWQANDSYDFAERYYSPDELVPGDVVLISQRGRFHVQRTLRDTDVPIGIVSTRPAFVAGVPATSTYPIALAGRVPTKVSTLKGTIKIGDPLAAASLPGVAVKATVAGPVVGYALEEYSGTSVGMIEVFVNAGWWGGPAVTDSVLATEAPASTTDEPSVEPVKSYQGVARILAGGIKVKITHPTLGTFPLIQVTPYGLVETNWWTDQSTDVSFEIILKKPLDHDVTFSWRAEGMLPTSDKIFLSNGTTADWNVYSGEVTIPEPKPVEIVEATSTPEVEAEVEVEADTIAPTQQVEVDTTTTATTTESVVDPIDTTSSTTPVITPAPETPVTIVEVVETVSSPTSEVTTSTEEAL